MLRSGIVLFGGKILGELGAENSGSKGGLQVGSVQAESNDVLTQEKSKPFNEDFRLNLWMRWLEEVDFENLWDNES